MEKEKIAEAKAAAERVAKEEAEAVAKEEAERVAQEEADQSQDENCKTLIWGLQYYNCILFLIVFLS